MVDAVTNGMDALNPIIVRHGRLVRVAWLAVLFVLAACTEPNGGGNGGY